MLLKDTQSEFELKFLGYQFPEPKGNDKYDANWLMISGNVRSYLGSWSFVHPIFLTWDIEDIASWFKCLAEDKPCNEEMNFFEPELTFKIVENTKEDILLKICFSHGALSPREKYKGFAEQNITALDLKLTIKDMYVAAESLLSELSLYPEREGLK